MSAARWELEEHWKYWVPQPLPDEAVGAAPESLRELKLLDPACGSGHFLVIAFDLLAALYEEEARHRGERWKAGEIAQWIVEKNLHGIDIDARAIQLSAASLWLKAKLYAPDVAIGRMNLVAPIFRLGGLPTDDPALVSLCDELERFVVPKAVTLKLVEALSGVDHLGTLLRVDEEVARLLENGEMGDAPLLAYTARKKSSQVLDRLTDFLDEHAAEADLGLRLEGEQLEAGMRFVSIARKDTYDIVVANPPYQGLSKTAGLQYVAKQYSIGKADLYAAFLVRGIELCRPTGLCAMVTMQGWLFLSQFTALRRWMLQMNSPRCIGDLMWCAFEGMRHATVAMTVTMRGLTIEGTSVALAPTERTERDESNAALQRKRASVLVQTGRSSVDARAFSAIDGEPFVYWWTARELAEYKVTPKVGAAYPARFGLNTGDNTRFLRKTWELRPDQCASFRVSSEALPSLTSNWTRYMKGSEGIAWQDPCDHAVYWFGNGLEVKAYAAHLYGSYSRQIRNERFYFSPGVAYLRDPLIRQPIFAEV